MTQADLPETHLDLLERPLFAHLATVRPDGAPQSSVMWFAWDGQRAKFSHTGLDRSTAISSMSHASHFTCKTRTIPTERLRYAG